MMLTEEKLGKGVACLFQKSFGLVMQVVAPVLEDNFHIVNQEHGASKYIEPTKEYKIVISSCQIPALGFRVLRDSNIQSPCKPGKNGCSPNPGWGMGVPARRRW